MSAAASLPNAAPNVRASMGRSPSAHTSRVSTSSPAEVRKLNGGGIRSPVRARHRSRNSKSPQCHVRACRVSLFDNRFRDRWRLAECFRQIPLRRHPLAVPCLPARRAHSSSTSSGSSAILRRTMSAVAIIDLCAHSIIAAVSYKRSAISECWREVLTHNLFVSRTGESFRQCRA